MAWGKLFDLSDFMNNASAYLYWAVIFLSLFSIPICFSDGPKSHKRKLKAKQHLEQLNKESTEPRQLSQKTLEKLEKSKLVTDRWLKDLEVPQDLQFEKPLCFDINDLNKYLTCGLCKGYLYEASTITECMHTCK